MNKKDEMKNWKKRKWNGMLFKFSKNKGLRKQNKGENNTFKENLI